MKNNSLQKKLAAYAALAAPFFAMPHHVDAQILYTNVIPDDTLTMCDTAMLDLNNDGITDFRLGVGKHIFNYWHACMIMDEGSASNRVAGIATSTAYGSTGNYFKIPFKLNYSDTIGASNNWVPPLGFNIYQWCNGSPMPWHSQAVFNFYGSSSSYIGYWTTGPTDGYIGLKINVNNQTYYGWARLAVDSDANWMILKAYAINTIPNESIQAGKGTDATIVEPSESAESPVTVSPNPATDHFLISFPKNIPGITQLNMIDMEGRKRNAEWIKNESGLLVNTSGLDDGIYLAEVKTAGAIYRKKVMIQK